MYINNIIEENQEHARKTKSFMPLTTASRASKATSSSIGINICLNNLWMDVCRYLNKFEV